MSQLKKENVKKCLSLLREYIEESSNDKKERAVLALDQLQKITAGANSNNAVAFIFCLGRPRADG